MKMYIERDHDEDFLLLPLQLRPDDFVGLACVLDRTDLARFVHARAEELRVTFDAPDLDLAGGVRALVNHDRFFACPSRRTAFVTCRREKRPLDFRGGLRGVDMSP